MSKKKHSKDKKKFQKVDLTKKPLPELETNAALYLEKSQYKKAIETYKAILSMKKNKDDVVEQKLMQSYTGRIKELGLKGMHKESIELYDHIKLTYGKELDLPFYVEQLFLIGDYPRAVKKMYTHRQEFNDPKQLNKLESTAALLILADTREIFELIPPHSPLLHQKDLIQEALLALFLQQEERVGEILNPIGLRSPYRDWKILIKGLTAFYRHRDQEAQDIFNRIPKDSTIACILPLFHSMMDAGKESQFPSCLPEETYLLNKILGDQAPLFSLAQAFLKAHQLNNQKEMLKIIRKFIDYLPSDSGNDREFLRQSSLNILLASSAQSKTSLKSLLKSYSSLWGDQLSLIEENRILALFYESQNRWDQAIDSWGVCVNEIKQDPVGNYFSTQEEKNIAIAQILRRMAEHCPKEDPLDNIFQKMLFGKEVTHKHDYISYLAESLRFDPDEPEVYEKIIQFHQLHTNKNKVQKWTEQYVHAFPDNINALLSAALLAFQRNALQKSLRFLDKILRYDPLNEQARNQKIIIHLRSARERIKKRKFDMARKDFQMACSLSTSKIEKATVDIIWGIAEIDMGDAEKGHLLIHEGLQLTGKATTVYFYTIVEGTFRNIPKNILHPYYEVLEKRLQQEPSIKEAQKLVQIPFDIIQRDHIQSDQSFSPAMRKEMKIVAPYLEKVFSHLPFAEKELLDICHYLATARLYPLLIRYAKKGEKEYKANPRFLFFSLIGQNEGVFESDDFELEDEFVEIQDLCMDINDYRTEHEIEDFLDQRHPFYTRKPHEVKAGSIFKPVVPLSKKRSKKPQPKSPKSKPKPRGRQLPLFGPDIEGM